MKFSIIIPAFNEEHNIRKCLDSVCLQDYNKNSYEVIVIDDCSSDNTAEIIKSYQKKYLNMKYIRHVTNRHQGGARNSGIKDASGDYIIFIDSDDCLIYKNTLSILEELTKRNKADILRSNSYTYLSSDYEYKSLKFSSENFNCKFYNSINYYNTKTFNNAVWGSCYKRDFIINNDLFFRENVFYEDTDWLLKAIYYASYICIFEFPFYGYRKNISSTTRNNNIISLHDDILSNIEVIKFFDKQLQLNPIIKSVIYYRIKISIISYIKRIGKYKFKDAYKCLILIKSTLLSNIKRYDLNKHEYVLFHILKYLPILLYIISWQYNKIKKISY